MAATSYVAPARRPGGTKPLYGADPTSFAWPRGGGRPPLVFDQASSASARGEIMIHQRDGEPIPERRGSDTDGNPTTDPAAALAGAQLPFGGCKGASIEYTILPVKGGERRRGELRGSSDGASPKRRGTNGSSDVRMRKPGP